MKLTMKAPTTLIAGSLLMLSLTACGTDPAERALTGAGVGAASGAVIGAAAGNPVLGAAVGAVVGGVGGAATSPSTVDLGKPVWKRH